MSNSTQIICITPVKNEEWILELFLESTSKWADLIIIADQNSSDSSVEIAKKFPKVKIIKNSSNIFNEPERQKILLNEARKIPGKKVIFALDADEILTPNWESELKQIKLLPEGTVIQLKWRNLHPDRLRYWTPKHYFNFAYMDDGREHKGKTIHSERIPYYDDSPRYQCKEISVMHLQYVNWNRMNSKHRWYQCYERVMFPEKNPISIFRMYNHMYGINDELKNIPTSWLDNYKKMDIDVFNIEEKEYYWWDKEVLKYLNEYSEKKFELLPIWDVDWNTVSQEFNILLKQEIVDPRCKKIKKIQAWLYDTQHLVNDVEIQKVDRLLMEIFDDNNI
ncbi:glycosyltransferase family 2 protein [Lysinibacillus fusiformis]|uniref:glycosyltransferase family 2 protein n=1 Tax=Lysinibacillus fusiformis TaxID=28031 RepID=UPI00215A5E7F|nr:glycosyltransferase family 2 protein [Lysinibacillus fusiformis]MCR8851202.1 glycosyltransferase family 2 protein [Lysinibacillus fusiformis]WKT77732.1 glycosyltransferase family 2 protein [Lysinibacillus fusiformis]